MNEKPKVKEIARVAYKIIDSLLPFYSVWLRSAHLTKKRKKNWLSWTLFIRLQPNTMKSKCKVRGTLSHFFARPLCTVKFTRTKRFGLCLSSTSFSSSLRSCHHLQSLRLYAVCVCPSTTCTNKMEKRRKSLTHCVVVLPTSEFGFIGRPQIFFCVSVVWTKDHPTEDHFYSLLFADFHSFVERLNIAWIIFLAFGKETLLFRPPTEEKCFQFILVNF